MKRIKSQLFCHRITLLLCNHFNPCRCAKATICCAIPVPKARRNSSDPDLKKAKNILCPVFLEQIANLCFPGILPAFCGFLFWNNLGQRLLFRHHNLWMKLARFSLHVSLQDFKLHSNYCTIVYLK